MDKKHLNVLLERLHEALEDMDAVSDGEEQEELCSEAEDLLFFIESTDLNDEDADEEIEDTLDQLIETLDAIDGDDEFAGKASVMRNAAEFAKRNL